MNDNFGIEYYFEKHLTDKGVNGYSNVYNELFAPKRYEKVNLLEIGIGTLNNTASNMLFWKNKYFSYLPGASLRAFRDYFPNGFIYGIDNQPDCMIEEDRIQTFLLDSTNQDLVYNSFPNIKFDFIIDDGDHYYESQIKTFQIFIKMLKKDGIYILEDLAYPNEIKKFFDCTNYEHNFRDGMVIIKNNQIFIEKRKIYENNYQ
jgi:SAM-dependent methyltransferase